MSKTSELYALRRSFSGDSTVKVQSRSGDKSESGAMLWDFVASTQSAEAYIVEAEELEEELEAKREFAKLLRLYFKKVLTASEYSFLAACIRLNKSLYAIGKSQGVKYKEVIESITTKCKRNEKQFFMLMSYSGYDSRRGCEFMSQIFNGDKRRRDIRAKLEAKKEARRIRDRLYYLATPEYQRARRKAYNEAHPLECKAYRSKYFQAHKEELLQRKREYRAKHREQERESTRKRRARNPEKLRAERARYREKHREVIRARNSSEAYKAKRNAREKAKRAEAKLKKLQEMKALEQTKT